MLSGQEICEGIKALGLCSTTICLGDAVLKTWDVVAELLYLIQIDAGKKPLFIPAGFSYFSARGRNDCRSTAVNGLFFFTATIAADNEQLIFNCSGPEEKRPVVNPDLGP